MGTNYYAHLNACKCCKRSPKIRHIGKSSGGWCFLLHVYTREWEDDEPKIHSWADWKRILARTDTIIRDEYDYLVTFADMVKIVERRSNPHGLRRHPVDYTHCIEHGSGTWDLIVGEFS